MQLKNYGDCNKNKYKNKNKNKNTKGKKKIKRVSEIKSKIFLKNEIKLDKNEVHLCLPRPLHLHRLSDYNHSQSYYFYFLLLPSLLFLHSHHPQHYLQHLLVLSLIDKGVCWRGRREL